MKDLGPDNAYWADDEWHSWDHFGPAEDEIDEALVGEIECHSDIRRQYPNVDLAVLPHFRELLALARWYFEDTGRHLAVYGDIGELFGAAFFGIRLNRNCTQGSDGRIGNDFVEIKTFAPMNTNSRIRVRLEDRNFSRLLAVKIDNRFSVTGRMITRRALIHGRTAKTIQLSWARVEAIADTESASRN